MCVLLGFTFMYLCVCVCMWLSVCACVAGQLCKVWLERQMSFNVHVASTVGRPSCANVTGWHNRSLFMREREIAQAAPSCIHILVGVGRTVFHQCVCVCVCIYVRFVRRGKKTWCNLSANGLASLQVQNFNQNYVHPEIVLIYLTTTYENHIIIC